jgi:hypothetical protein
VDHELDAVGVAGLRTDTARVPDHLGAVALVLEPGRSRIGIRPEVPVVLRRITSAYGLPSAGDEVGRQRGAVVRLTLPVTRCVGRVVRDVGEE